MNTFLADSVGTCEIAGKKIARPGFGAMRLTGLGIRGEPGDRAECGTGRTRRGRVAGAPSPRAGGRQPRTRRPFRKNQATVIPPYEAGPGRPHDLPPSSCPRSAWDREGGAGGRRQRSRRAGRGRGLDLAEGIGRRPRADGRHDARPTGRTHRPWRRDQEPSVAAFGAPETEEVRNGIVRCTDLTPSRLRGVPFTY